MGSDGKAYLRTVASLWIALLAIAYFYSVQQHIPRFIVFAFVAAALLETALYLVPGFRRTRETFDSIAPPAMRALVLAASAVLPYVVYGVVSGTFHWRWFAVIALLASVASAWFVVQAKRTAAVDVLFLAFMAGVLLSKVFGRVYVDLHPRVPADILGHLMWIRVGILSVLSFRKLGGIGFGFLPTRKDWSIGFQHFLLFIPAGILLGLWLQFMQPRTPGGPWWRTAALAIGTFFGILWVVALSEEFFFRGVLQQVLAKITKNRWGGLVLASIAFGLVHLPFRHFPNWRFALVAAVAGLFYGLAYMRTSSVRAPMVTHALVVTTWRVFFA